MLRAMCVSACVTFVLFNYTSFVTTEEFLKGLWLKHSYSENCVFKFNFRNFLFE